MYVLLYVYIKLQLYSLACHQIYKQAVIFDHFLLETCDKSKWSMYCLYPVRIILWIMLLFLNYCYHWDNSVLCPLRDSRMSICFWVIRSMAMVGVVY